MRNGSGTYQAPSGSWNPATNGNSATAADWNTLLADIASALTQSVSADGQTPITGNLNMGNNKLTSLAAGSASGQSVAWQQLFSQGTEADIASASTVDIGAQNTNFLRVTGTTTITSFGTNYNGPRFLRFAGILTLTHNASTLILPSGGNITTAAGDMAIAIPISGGWYVYYFPTTPVPFVMSSSANRTSSGYFTTFSSSSGDQINASTGTFTCARPGVYCFTANFRSFGTPSSTSAHIFNLGASRAAGNVNSQVSIWYDALVNPTKDCSCSFVARMAVGDTVRPELLTYGSTGTTVNCTLFTGAFVSV